MTTSPPTPPHDRTAAPGDQVHGGDGPGPHARGSGPLPWAELWQRRCRAVGGDGVDWGRCELRRGHAVDHALERGMHVLRFGPLRVWLDAPVGAR